MDREDDRVATAASCLGIAPGGDWRLSVGIVAALALGGCASARLACPERGGPSWLELRTQHFVLRTDLPSDEARRWMAQMEQTRASLLQAAWHGAAPPAGRIDVVLFRDLGELHDFAPLQAEGVALWDFFGNHLLVAQGGQRHETASVRAGQGIYKVNRVIRPEVTLAHEIAHALNNAFLFRQPRWLAEGLAKFLETVAYDAATGKATIGEPPEVLAAHVTRRDVRLNPSTLLAGREVVLENSVSTISFYADSWALVHWLLNNRAEQFNRYQARLRRGEDPDAAWAEIGVRGSDLDNQVHDYFGKSVERAGQYHTYSVDVPAWSGEIESRAVSDADVHALWAQLLRGLQPDDGRERLAAEVAEGVRLDPRSPAVVSASFPDLSGADRLTRARGAVSAHPDDWRAYALLARSSQSLDDRAAALEEAMAHALREAGPARALALVRAEQGRGKDAVALARRAMVLGGVTPQALFALSAGLRADGQCAEAALVARRALDFSSHEPPKKVREQLLELADHIERDCQAAQ
jgi:hypothetical protein